MTTEVLSKELAFHPKKKSKHGMIAMLQRVWIALENQSFLLQHTVLLFTKIEFTLLFEPVALDTGVIDVTRDKL